MRVLRTVHLFLGLAGSGKSTLARQLAELSNDELNELRLHIDRAVTEREERALDRETLANADEEN